MTQEVNDSAGLTVEQARYELTINRLADQERRHSQELVDLQVRNLLETQTLRKELEKANARIAELTEEREAKSVSKKSRSS